MKPIGVGIVLSLVAGAVTAGTTADDLLLQYQQTQAAAPAAPAPRVSSSATCDASACAPTSADFPAPQPDSATPLARMMGLDESWPSFIRCADYADQERLLILFATYDRSVKYTNAGDTYVSFNYDGSYRTGAYIKSCKGKSIQQLVREGTAFY